MRNRRLALSLVAAMVCGTLLSLVGHAQADPASRALDYLRSTQQADGSIPAGSFGGYSASEWYVIASAGNGFDPNAMNNGGASAVAYLEQHAAAASSGAAQAGLLAQALVSAGVDPSDVSGVNVISAITSTYHTTPTSSAGSFGDGRTYTQALAITGLRADGVSVTSTAYAYLEGTQDSDGGFNWLGATGATDSDTNSTAMAVMALATDSSAAAQAAIARALTYFHTQQGTDGGFGYCALCGTDADSTSLVIQAIVAARQDPTSAAWTRNGVNAYASLLAQQDSGGGFGYQGATPDSYTSAQAVFGLERQPLPATHTFSSAYSTTVGDNDARHAVAYLQSQLANDGALPGFSGDDPSLTSDLVIGAAAAGVDPATLNNGQPGAASALQYLESVSADPSVTGSAGRLGKLIEAAVAARQDPANFGARDVIAELQSMYSASYCGAYGDGETTTQALAILGLVAAHQAVPAAAVTYLENLRDLDGGWNFTASADSTFGSDTNSTAMALMALDAAGVHSDDAAAIAWLRTQEAGDAGFAYQSGSGSDADSTSLVIQALVAAHENPAGAAFVISGSTPVMTLASGQDASGGFGYQTYPPDVFTTSQVIGGLLRAPFPVTATFSAGATAQHVNVVHTALRIPRHTSAATHPPTASGCDVPTPMPSPTGPPPAPVGGIDSAIHVATPTPAAEPSAAPSPRASPTPATEVPKTGAEPGDAPLATVTSAAHPDDSNWMVYLIAALCAMAIVVVASLVVRGRRA